MHLPSPAATLVVLLTAILLSACGGGSSEPVSVGYGTDPKLPAPKTRLIPTVNVAKAERWNPGEQPVSAPGLAVTEFASGLDHPRWLYQLPNGDVLVAESNAPAKSGGMSGIKAFFMKLVMNKAGAGTPSADRITLLRDADGDGIAEINVPFINDLYSPFGMTMIADTLYVANANGVVSYPYETGSTEVTELPEDFFALPGGPLNHHWTKNIIASPDNKHVYVAVGSNSNIAENGMAAEQGRAAIWQIDVASKNGDVFADGLRNPVGMDFAPDGRLYTVVNERDMLGDNLVPDYLTGVEDGDFYGWPWSYFGDNVDERVSPRNPGKVAEAQSPEYALGSHTASLGLEIVDGVEPGLGSRYGQGAYIGQHGSWNRKPRSGYKVLFVPFKDNRPAGDPIEILTGFVQDDIAKGRPVGVLLDQRGGLLVADDVGNRIWRLSSRTESE